MSVSAPHDGFSPSSRGVAANRHETMEELPAGATPGVASGEPRHNATQNDGNVGASAPVSAPLGGSLCKHCGNPLSHHPMTFRSERFGVLHCSGDLPEGKCTGMAARWCPIHGDCTNRDTIEDDDDFTSRYSAHCSDRECPLHGESSDHAEYVQREAAGQ